MKEVFVVFDSEVNETDLEFYREEYPESSEEQWWKGAYDDKAYQHGDLVYGCSVMLPSCIIAIANLGFWNGRKRGYRLFGRNLAEIFYPGDNYDRTRWTVDRRGNLKGTLVHHDNAHYLEYRMLRPELSEEQLDNFLGDIAYSDKVLDLNKYTVRIGDYLNDLYGYVKSFRSRPKLTQQTLWDLGKEN